MGGIPMQYGYNQPQQNTVVVITSQAQVPTWPSVQFLDRTQRVRLIEEKPCCGLPLDILCLKWCFRRKLRITDERGVYFGFSESPCKCCATEKVYAHVPEDSTSLVMKRKCLCGEWCGECCCPCCYMCKDIRIKEIYDNRGMKIGSFEYSPVCCRSEPFCCCKGRYVIKTFDGERAFHVPKLSCCNCKEVMWCPTCLCGDIPLLMCTNKAIICPMCQQWNVPVKILGSGNDTTVGHVNMINEPWCKQKCCCVPVKYDVKYDRSPESLENKALLFGSALIMDHHGLIPRLYNDPDITCDDEENFSALNEVV